MAERARHLEQSLLRLGQFQHALSELIAWIDATDKMLDEEIRPTAGDPHLLEVQLAKLKVIIMLLFVFVFLKNSWNSHCYNLLYYRF